MDWENLSLDEMWDIFIEYNICSEETLQVVTSINGYSEETMLDILFVTTGLRNFEQLAEDLGIDIDDEEDYEEDYE